MYPTKNIYPAGCSVVILRDRSFTALISKLNGRAPPKETLDFASAVGAFVASCPGGYPEYNIRQVYALMNTKRSQTFLNSHKTQN